LPSLSFFFEDAVGSGVLPLLSLLIVSVATFVS
jgi:hypothetical protein